MNVRFTIKYTGTLTDATTRLQGTYGGVNQAIVDGSSNSVTLHAIAEDVLVARDMGTYRLFIFNATGQELQAFVEENPDWDVLPAAGVAWRGITESLKGMTPVLDRAILASDSRNAEILLGKAGMWKNVRQPDIWVALGTAAFVALYVAVAARTFGQTTWPGLLGGLIPPLITIGLLTLTAYTRSKSARIFWESRENDR